MLWVAAVDCGLLWSTAGLWVRLRVAGLRGCGCEAAGLLGCGAAGLVGCGVAGLGGCGGGGLGGGGAEGVWERGWVASGMWPVGC